MNNFYQKFSLKRTLSWILIIIILFTLDFFTGSHVWWSIKPKITFVFNGPTVSRSSVEKNYFSYTGKVLLPENVDTSKWETYSTDSYEFKYPTNWKRVDGSGPPYDENHINVGYVNLLVPSRAFNSRVGIQVRCRSLPPPNSECEDLNYRTAIDGLDNFWNIYFNSIWGSSILDKREVVFNGPKSVYERVNYRQTNVDTVWGAIEGFNGSLDLMTIYTTEIKNGKTFQLILVSKASGKLTPWQIDDFMKITSTFKIK